jgi:lambda family phage portal protein
MIKPISKSASQFWNVSGNKISRSPFPTNNRSGYGNYGASRRKLANAEWKALSGSADEDIIYNLPLLRVRSRDLFMGSPIAGGAILTLRTNTIGSGLIPLPKVDGDVLGLDNEDTAEVNKLIKSEFFLFANTVECDWNRRNTFSELQDLAFVNMCISGDVLGLLPMKTRRGSIYDTRIRLIEADRVADPVQPGDQITNDGAFKIFGGVELTDDGEVDAYHVAPRHPGYTTQYAAALAYPSADFLRVPAFGEETGRPVSMLVGEFERPEQRRGVPLMSKCLTELKQLQRYIESVTIQNVIKSYFAAFIKSEFPSAEMFDRLVSSDELDDMMEGLAGRSQYDIRLAPGIVNWMRPGEDITFPLNAGPDAQFEPFVIALCKFIGTCLGIPFEVLLRQFNSSYSASRAALLEFWRRVKVLRELIVNQFCQPVYLAWMYEAVARGIFKRYPVRGFFEDPRIRQAWTRCDWAGSSPGSIDPLKEILACEKRLHIGISTLEQETLEFNGGDWRANTVQQGIELEEATANRLTYIRNLDAKYLPIVDPGVEDETAATVGI